MLSFLEIQNVAIIDKISIEFGTGFNVMTGETGAGKSIIINSINAILGERISKDIIRTGENKAYVCAIFYTNSCRVHEILKELNIPTEDDGALIISREIHTSGKNICRINGQIVPLSVLKRVGEYIINIHGQHDNKVLLLPQKHIDLLDLFIGNKIEDYKEEYRQKLGLLCDEKQKLLEIMGDGEPRERKIDLLKYQIQEIQDANLTEGEDVKLEKKRLVVANTEKIKMALGNCYDILSQDNGVRDAIGQISNSISNIATLDDKYSKLLENVTNVMYQLDDITYEVRDNLDNLFFDQELRENIDERIDQIARLKKKYKDTIPEIINYMKECEDELEKLVNSEEYINKTKERIKALNDELLVLAKKMSSLRSQHAKVLQDKITHELKDLEMRDSNFMVDLEFCDKVNEEGLYEFCNNGLDRVEFFISTNKGEKEKPLSKIASGGEMSRIMLAIKSIISDKDNIESLIFDEIDTGISGRAAQRVGEKLAKLAKTHQLICITHLSQIATMADNHYMIEKSTNNDKTKTDVKKLSGDEMEKEVARIIGGLDISDITIKNASEMIRKAREWKNIN